MALSSAGSSNPGALEKVDYHAWEALRLWGSTSEPSSSSHGHLKLLREAARHVPEDVLKTRCERVKILAVTTKLMQQLDDLGSTTTHSSAPHAILVATVRSTAAAIANALHAPWCQPGVAPRPEVMEAIRSRDWFTALQALSLQMIVDTSREAEQAAEQEESAPSLLKRRKLQVGAQAARTDLLGAVRIINEKGLPQPVAPQANHPVTPQATLRGGVTLGTLTPGAKRAASEAERMAGESKPQNGGSLPTQLRDVAATNVTASLLRRESSLAGSTTPSSSLLFDGPMDQPRKSGKRWTPEEEQRLIQAWKQCGKQGCWEEIRRRSDLKQFTGTQLKDKLRNLERSGHPDVK